MRVRRRCTGLLLTATLVVAVTAPASAETAVSRADVVAFQAHGFEGGGVLAPVSTTYPPTTRGFATLKRGTDWIGVNIQTSNLPAGAYTVWWLIFDDPDGCNSGCGVDDVVHAFTISNDADLSIFWATGGVVRENGIGNFVDRYTVGDALGESGTQHLIGNGGDPDMTSQAEIHNIIKYHGPASDDADVLRSQTTTVGGSCQSGANAVDLGAPFGVQCFDPQAVVHPMP